MDAHGWILRLLFLQLMQSAQQMRPAALLRPRIVVVAAVEVGHQAGITYILEQAVNFTTWCSVIATGAGGGISTT
jgi:hypothetical protein